MENDTPDAMTDNHPITPPPELVLQWRKEWAAGDSDKDSYQNIATQSARWGADQELEACCEWLTSQGLVNFPMRGMLEARRPKPPSLKEQAQAELDRLIALIPTEGAIAMAEPIRRALETLDD